MGNQVFHKLRYFVIFVQIWYFTLKSKIKISLNNFIALVGELAVGMLQKFDSFYTSDPNFSADSKESNIIIYQILEGNKHGYSTNCIRISCLRFRVVARGILSRSFSWYHKFYDCRLSLLFCVARFNFDFALGCNRWLRFRFTEI